MEEAEDLMLRGNPYIDVVDGLECNKIDTRLFQGSAPPKGPAVRSAGFNFVVLTADDVHYEDADLPGLTLYRISTQDNKDQPLSDPHIDLAHAAAEKVVEAIQDEQNVLVTCLGGFNRSGLVVALALYKLYGWPGDRIIRHIQDRRDFALHNKEFCRYIRNLGTP